MTRFRLIVRSLLHYWRTNLAILLGVVAGTAVIGGALIVGDSVRASLRQMTLNRLGQIDFVVSGPRFVREDLAAELQQRGVPAQPAIIMQAGLQTKLAGTIRRAGQVNVYGVADGAWSLMETKGIARPNGTEVVLNAQAATSLHAKVGDEVTIWIELPSAVPRDTLLGRKDNDSQEITLKVSAIAPDDSGLARLGLNPTQALPLNAFVDLHVLQERLGLEHIPPSRRDPVGKPGRVNALLMTGPGRDLSKVKATTDKYNAELRQAIQLSDLNLRLVHDPELNCEVLESEQMILEDKLAAAAEKAAGDLKLATSPVMVYLANKILNPRLEAGDVLARALKGNQQALQSLKDLPATGPGFSMYSTVAGLDVLNLEGTPFDGFEFVGDRPQALGSSDVVINQWLAEDLRLEVGDNIRFAYHIVGSRGELPEEDRTATVRGIVKMTGAATDRNLTPQVKGITDVESLADWDQPFEMNLGVVTPRDDDYWDKYRATPKLYLPLKSAQAMWPSRYGTLTSLRFGSNQWNANGNKRDFARIDTAQVQARQSEISAALLKHVDPAELGLAFLPVKAIGLMAASGSTDFSGLFFGFSLFLIVAAMILIGLLFRLGIEQRVRDLGLFGAIGFTPTQVHRQMLLEGLIVVVAGGLAGLVAAVGYAQGMIYGLTHWWVGAIGTKDLILAVTPVSLVGGFAIAVITALAAIWWALRQLKGLSLREQLAGVTEKEVDLAVQQQRVRKAARRAVVSAGLAAVLTVAVSVRIIPAAATFFIVGILALVATLSFLSSRLTSSTGTGGSLGRGTAALGRLGMRNASRQRLRSVMTAGMIASATFLIVTVAAFRRDPTSDLPDKKSGNGGFTLVAESSSPVLYDLNTAEGRKKLQLSAPDDSPAAKALAAMKVVPIRVKPGDDASCLNLYQTRVPRILGVPQSLMDENRFAFAMGSWKPLIPQAEPRGSAAVPVLGDMNTLMFSMHKSVGQTIGIPSDDHPQHQLKIAGMFQDSVFQGVLVMNEDDFLKLYPEQKGFRYFLIEVPPQLADAASSLLETELAEYGFDAEPVSERLARFLSVQNTYLSTFQTLGGLGLLLGTFGLATVMLRNVLERQAELALFRAVGFRKGSVGTLVLLENAIVLSWGLLSGLLSALLAVAPNLVGRGADVPIASLLGLIGIVFVTGMVAAAVAVRSAVNLPIVATLRGD